MLGAMSITHWAILLVVVSILFGRNKISSVMGDLGKGLRELKSGLNSAQDEVRQIEKEH